MPNQVVIDQFSNTVTTDTTSTQNQVLLSPDNSNVVQIIENTGGIVTVSFPGPQGAQGASGSQGPSGSIDPNYNTGSFSGSFTGELIGTASYSPNLYNSNGSLIGNRIVTLDDKQLIYRSSGSTLQNYTFSLGSPTGVTPPTWPASIIQEGVYIINGANSEPYNTRVWGRNQGSTARSFWVNQVYADMTNESTGAGSIYNQWYSTRRGSQLDTATGAVSTMIGLASQVGHAWTTSQNSTTASIVTTTQEAVRGEIVNYVGTVTNAYSFRATGIFGYSTLPRDTYATNYFGLRVDTSVGFNASFTSSLTNYYGIYLGTLTVGAGGSITNRWGIYAPDSTMKYHINGNVSIGTLETGSFKMLVSGSTKLSGSVDITGVLTAPIVTGSLFGTSSWAQNTSTASSADNFIVRQSVTASSALITGTITAQTLVVQTITSSIDYVTGSTRFGSQLTDTHAFTGSVSITGSLTVDGTLNATASYAITASYALNAGAGASVAANIFNYYNFI
jgi:hypothetical protein